MPLLALGSSGSNSIPLRIKYRVGGLLINEELYFLGELGI